MSKSVLVIDTPETCGKCQYCQQIYTGEHECVLNGDIIYNRLKKMDFCQLLSLGKLDGATKAWLDGYNHGWHSAIEEMIG